MEFVLQVWELIRPHVWLFGLVATWAGIVTVALRRRSDWRRKRFDTVNVSLNYLENRTLSMRTLLETTLKEIWLNDYGVALVVKAAQKTTPEQPFVLLTDPADMGYIKRAIKNVLSEHFSEAFVAHSQGVPVAKARYVYALTYEKYQSIRELKFRVVVCEEKTLLASFGPTAGPAAVSSERHADRVRVLRMMADLVSRPGATVDGADVLDRVELGVIPGGAPPAR